MLYHGDDSKVCVLGGGVGIGEGRVDIKSSHAGPNFFLAVVAMCFQ